MKLGIVVKHKTQGWIGTVVGAATYLYRQDQWLVHGLDSTGRPIGEWYAADELEQVVVAGSAS